MLTDQSIQYASISDIGFRRQNNQDSCSVRLCTDGAVYDRRGHLFVVADGMGGHAVGELASKIAVDTIPHVFLKVGEQSVVPALREAIEEANRTINSRGTKNRDFERMGTTCTTLVLSPEGAIIGHVGDSRCYRVRNHRIDQLTSDHSLVWELIQQRRVHPRDASAVVPKNIITRSLGPEPQVKVDIEGPHAILPGDTYLLCSDGLTNMVSDTEIGMVAGELSPHDACRLLTHLANLRGGLDNITIVIARVAGAAIEPTMSGRLPALLPSAMSWITFAWLTLTLGLAVAGACLFLLPEHRPWGVATFAIAIIVFLLGILRRQRIEQSLYMPVHDPQSTVIWRPYRTASAKIAAEFVERLAKTHDDLQRAAVDEGWDVDWTAHVPAIEQARIALQERRHANALHTLAKSIDVLMTGVHEQRRQMQHESRWGKPTPKPT